MFKLHTPRGLLTILTLSQIMMYFDRGLIAGYVPAIQSSLKGPDLSDASAGVLGSGFVFGYMLACPLFALFSRKYSPFKLMAIGLFLWINATALCGLTNNYIPLLGARILTGVGEASFAGLAPTAIDDVAPLINRTVWLAIFFSGLPIGAAAGYGIAAITAPYSWHIGFILESVIMIPLTIIVLVWPNNIKPDPEPVSVSAVTVDNNNNNNNQLTPLFNTTKQPSPIIDAADSDTDTELDDDSSLDDLVGSRSLGGSKSYPSLIRAVTESAATATAARNNNNTNNYSPSHVFRNHLINSNAPNITEPLSISTSNNTTESTESQPLLINSTTTPNNLIPSTSPIVSNPDDDGFFLTDLSLILCDSVYLLLVLGYSSLAFVIGALSFWGPADFSRTLNISLQSATTAIGIITFICGLLGTGLGGWMLDRQFTSTGSASASKGMPAVLAAMKLCVTLTTIAILFASVSVYIANIYISLGCLAIANLCMFGVGAPVNAALLSCSPRELRSLAMSLSILIMHALGDLPSPFLLGWTTDHISDVRLALVALVGWLTFAIIFWGAAGIISYKRIETTKLRLINSNISINSNNRSNKPPTNRIPSYNTLHDSLSAVAERQIPNKNSNNNTINTAIASVSNPV